MDLATGITGVAATLEGQALALCNVAGGIVSESVQVADSRWYKAAGLMDSPRVITAGPINENAALLGKIKSGDFACFRGTVPADDDSRTWQQRVCDWIQDAEAELIEWRGLPGKVHAGFAAAIDSLLSVTSAFSFDTKRMLFFGHSKGAALAVLSAALHASQGGESTVITFGGPRAANVAFTKAFAKMPIRMRRYENSGDLVPLTPLRIAHAEMLGHMLGVRIPSFDYESVGELQFIDGSGEIGGESAFQRVKAEARLVELLAERKFTAVRDAHSIGFGGAYAAAVAPEVAP